MCVHSLGHEFALKGSGILGILTYSSDIKDCRNACLMNVMGGFLYRDTAGSGGKAESNSSSEIYLHPLSTIYVN